MRDVRVATAQFEHRDGDKEYNLGRVEYFARQAAGLGARVVAFHECCLVGYTVLQAMRKEEIDAWAEAVPGGPTLERLGRLAHALELVIGVGLIERGGDGRLFNTYAVVGPRGLLGKHRKINDFISPHIANGEAYTVFEYGGTRFGVLTCYDNNLPENVRCTTLMGAEVILMPHVTGCTPSPMPGRGPVDRRLWENRERDPARLRMEFQGPKGRGWLMRWLPARCWENGVYALFANPIGVDYDTIKPGLAMIVDPHGEVLSECHGLGDDLCVAMLTERAYREASGRRYLAARRPELYERLVQPHPPGFRAMTRPGWHLAYDRTEEQDRLDRAIEQ